MNIRTLSTHILEALARAQIEGRRSNLETLREELGVRRTDIRTAVSQLHRERMLDALTMRLTLVGFAIGQSLARSDLPSLRQAMTTEVAPGEAARPAVANRNAA